MATIEDLRTKTGELLDEGLKTGALTVEEHSWRRNHLSHATDPAALEALVQDLLLPVAAPSAVAPMPVGPKASLACVLSNRSLVLADLGARSEVATVLGSSRLDLRGLAPDQSLDIEVAVVLGEAVIEVPEGTSVRVTANPVLGDCRVDPGLSTDAPRVLIRGDVVLGSLRVVKVPLVRR